MFKGNFRFKNASGTPYTYSIGEIVIFQGKIYECTKVTQQSPFQSPQSWKVTQLTEPYQDSEAPLQPEKNQFWFDENDILYIRQQTPTGFIWKQISGGGTASGPTGPTGPAGPPGATGTPGSGAPGNNDVGVMYLKGNTTATPIGSINDRAVVLGTMQTGALYNFAKDSGTNSLKYLGSGGRFHIIANFNFYSGSQDICGFYVGHNTSGLTLDPNNDRISESEIYANASTPSGQPVSSTIQTLLDLNTNDRVFFIVQNKSSTNNITVEFLKYTVTALTAEKGNTGATGPQGNTGATGPVGDYVISIRGITGTVGITNGSGIGLTVSGQTMTFSNTGVLSFNGLTGDVTGVTTGSENTFGPLQRFNNGISAAGGTFSRTLNIPSGSTLSVLGRIVGNVVNSIHGFTGGVTFAGVNGITIDTAGSIGSAGRVNIGIQTSGGTSSTSAFSFLVKTGSTSGNVTTLSNTTDLIYYHPQSSLPVTLVGATGINIRGGGGSSLVTFSDINQLNLPSRLLGVSITSLDKFLTIQDGSAALIVGSTTGIRLFSGDGSFSEYTASVYPKSLSVNRVYELPDANGTFALTEATQTFNGTNTFNTITNFQGGVSAAGATFSSTTNTINIIASTDGAGLRIARATTGANSRIGGIRLGMSTSGNNTYIENSAGVLSIYAGSDNNTTNPAAVISNHSILFGNTATNSTAFNCKIFTIGDGLSPRQYNGQQLILDNDRKALYFGDTTGVTEGNFLVNRTPSTAFPVGITYAMEVNSKTGKNISLVFNDKNAGISGSTAAHVGLGVDSSGNFEIFPTGTRTTINSLLNVPNGISAAGATLSSNTTIPSGSTLTVAGTIISDSGYRISSSAINTQTGTTYTFLASDNGKIVTFNNGSAITATIPTGLPVGFNCTTIQLGAGQVGFTAASGVTLQSYGNQYKLIGQHASATIIEYSADIVNLSGNLIV